MPSSRDASSSDLGRARELSRRLAQEAPAAGKGAAPAPAAPRFSADLVRGAPPKAPAPPAPPAAARPAPGAPPARPPPPAPAAAPARLPPVPTAGGFDALAGWVREVLAADAAFVLDDRGLLVASVGRVPPEEAEAVGARLVFTLEQADQMKDGTDRTRSIGIEFSGSWLTGWRFPHEGIVLTVGVVTPRPPAPGAGTLVARAFGPPSR